MQLLPYPGYTNGVVSDKPREHLIVQLVTYPGNTYNVVSDPSREHLTK